MIWTVILVLVGLLVLALVVLGISVFGGKVPIPDGWHRDGVEVVKDLYVSAYLLDLESGGVALIDTGTDRSGKALLAALGRRGVEPEAVKAVLLTHGDTDHTAGAHLFPQATLMALAPDVPLVEGRAVRGPFGSPRPNGLHVARVLEDGEIIDLGGTKVEVLAVPGHTPGSAAFLARGTLFLGDSAEVASSGTLTVATWFFCGDRAQNRASLRALAERLEPCADEVKIIACSHSGVVTDGLAPLRVLAAQLAP
jgi:hydroxyacylglutathione hydrolase